MEALLGLLTVPQEPSIEHRKDMLASKVDVTRAIIDQLFGEESIERLRLAETVIRFLTVSLTITPHRITPLMSYAAPNELSIGRQVHGLVASNKPRSTDRKRSHNEARADPLTFARHTWSYVDRHACTGLRYLARELTLA